MPHTGSIAVNWGENRTIGYVPQGLDFDKTLPVTVDDFMAIVCQKRRPAFIGLSKASRLQRRVRARARGLRRQAQA